MLIDRQFKKATEFYNKGDYKNALSNYKKLLNTTANTAFVYYNIGLCHYSMQNFLSAEKMFQKSYTYGFKKSGYELALSKLNLGKLEEGLEYYSYRYFGNSYKFPDLPLKKAVKYEDLVGKRVFVLNEQGYGDEILFSRTLKMLNEVCTFTKYQVYPELYDLFYHSFKYDNIEFYSDRSFDYDFIKGYDCWIPSGDIFKIFTLKFGFEYVPIKINTEIEENSVAVCWFANTASKNTKLRSVDEGKVKQYLSGKKIYSLQKDVEVDWAITPKLKTFYDTLNIMKGVEEVNTVDTSVIHLALVSNKKTKLLHNGKYIDWRFKYPLYGIEVERVEL